MLRKLLFFSLLSSLFGCNSDGKPNWFSSNGYHVTKDKVWFKTSEGISYSANIVTGADPKTFVARDFISKKTGERMTFGFDQQHVFLGAALIEGAEVSSFDYLFGNYSKDKNAIYYFSGKLTSDVANFTWVSQNFVKDTQHVYFGGNVFSDDPTHFIQVGGETSIFFKDSHKCWYSITEIPDADPATFRFIKSSYAADAKHLYFESGSILGADQKSFVVLEKDYSKDARYVYLKSERINGADPHSFQVLASYYNKDANHCYYLSEVMPTADPTTFKVVAEGYAKDDRQVFISAQVIIGADPATFRVLNASAGCSCDAHYAYSLSNRIQGVDPKKFEKGKKCVSCNGTSVNFEN
jgi:hypothetical protein